jgi:hypothetical protein
VEIAGNKYAHPVTCRKVSALKSGLAKFAKVEKQREESGPEGLWDAVVARLEGRDRIFRWWEKISLLASCSGRS